MDERAAAPRAGSRLGRRSLRLGLVATLVALVPLALLARLTTDRAEAALAVARDQARDASRLKTEFLSRVSHELRTPLNAILGFGQLLQLDDLTQEQSESVDHMVRGGRHLLGLINEVLDISRIETGSLALSVEVVELQEVVTETTDLIGPLAAEREITLEGPAPGDRPWVVQADRQRLKQVLLNLTSNAVKYNHHGGAIRIACAPAPEGRIAVTVSDTGPGIPPDRMERLFLPFDRLRAEQTDVQGTGLGLALSQGLMEAMGGTLTATSAEGQGTTFTLDLALGDRPADEGDQPPPELAAPTPGPVTGPEHTILYVEDNPSNLRLVERVLARRGGVRLLTAEEGEIVQELVRQHRPDLILLDLHLPGIDGEEVLRRLRADPRTADLPVVMVSADVTPWYRERLLEAGAADYLTKPLDVPRFLEVVNGLLVAAAR
jgi:signal transduction histidine kinase/CheY-like chemotaxis protein